MRGSDLLGGLAAVAAIAALGACAGGPPPPAPSPLGDLLAVRKLTVTEQRGHDFALQRCAGCHTIGDDDGGAMEGPPFRRMARRYNDLQLERRFAEVSAHGVDMMPPVDISRSEASDLIDYLNTLNLN